jgi:hypothetical protein
MRLNVLPLLALCAAAACTNQPFTLDVPLRVVSTAPSGGATGVARKALDGTPAPIVAAFSEELDPATVSAAAVTLAQVAADGTLTPVDAAAPVFSAEADGRFLVTLIPSKRLAYSQKYRLTLGTALARKRDHGRLPTTVKSDFTTEDPPPLAIVFAKPSEGGTGVTGATAAQERSPVLKVRFSEPVDCASVTGANVVVTETFDAHPHTAAAARTVPGTWQCNSAPASAPERLEGTDCLADTDPESVTSECVITFKPAGAVPVLSWSSALAVKLTGGKAADHPLQSVRATALGGQLPVTVTEHSTVLDPPALALTDTSPAAGATGVARDAALVLDFSEPVDCAQLQAVAVIEELRDPHPHVPAPSAPEASTAPGSRARRLWPAPAGGAAGGSWTCPDLAGVSPIEHSCGASGERCRVIFTPVADTNNAAEGADAKPFEYSSVVQVTLPGGGYGTAALLAARGAVESARATSRGGELGATVALAFRTQDPPSFAVTGASPADGAHGVQRDADLLLQFSGAVDCAQLLANAVVLEQRDAHPHVPVPAQRAGTTAKVRQLWPAVSGQGAGGAWQCPAQGAGLGASFARFTPSPDPAGANALADDGKALAYSSTVIVQLTGGVYTDHGAPPASRVVESALATTYGGALASNFALAFHTEDPPPLRLASAAPGNGATGVQRDATQVAFAFDQPIDCGGSLAASVTETYDPLVAARLGGAGAPVPGQAGACSGAGFTWSPSSAAFRWQYSSAVAVSLGSGAFGATPSPIESVLATTRSGQLITGASTDAFSVVDPPPLHLVAVAPSPGATGVPLGAPLVLSFSRAVDPTTFSLAANLSLSQGAVSLVSGGSVAGGPVGAAAASGFDAAKSTYTFVPSAPFHQSAVLTATVTSPYSAAGVRAADATSKGGWLVVQAADTTAPPAQTTRTFTFRAQDPAPLGILFTQPNQGGQAAGDANITAAFSRPVLCGAGILAPGLGADAALTAADTTPGNPGPTWVASCPAPDRAQLALQGSATPRPLDNIHVVLAANVAAADATVLADGSEFGLLPAGAAFDFTVQFTPLGVASTVPPAGATAYAGTDLDVVFSSPVLASAFKACGAGGTPSGTGPGTPAGCNFQFNDLTSGGAVVSIGSVTNSTGGATPDATAVFHAAASLTTGHSYQLTLFGGLYTSAGLTLVRLPNASGTSFLPQAFVLAFTAGNTSVVQSTSPGNGATNVQVGAPICATFSGAVQPATLTSANFTLQFTSAEGTLTLPWSGVTNPSVGTYCLNLTPESILNYLGGQRTLLYNATYTATIGSNVTLVGGNPPAPNGLPYTFTFTTQAQPPALAATTYANGFVSARTLLGGADVPLDAQFTVALSNSAESFVAASVAPAVTLVAGNPPFASAPASIALAAPAVSGSAFTIKPAAPLAFGTKYTLLLQVGQGGLKSQQGTNPANWLDSADGYPIALPFQTAAQTTAVIGPLDAQITSEVLIPIVFSRPAALATATSAAIIGKSAGLVLGGFVSEYAPVPTAVNYLAQPTWPNNSTATNSVEVNTASTAGTLVDEIGDKIAPVSQTWVGTPNLSSVSAQTPSGVTAGPTCVYTVAGAQQTGACNLSPGPNALLGDQPVRIGFNSGANSTKERMQPDAVSAQNLTLTPVSGGCAAVPLVATFVPGCTLGSCPASTTPYATTAAGDQVVFAPKDPVGTPANRIAGGCTYTLTLKQSQFTNLYGLTGPGDTTFSVSGVAATPRLQGGAATAIYPNPPSFTLGTVPGRVALSAALVIDTNGRTGANDTVAPESLAGNVVGSVTSGAGTFPSGTVSASGNVITFTPGPGQFFTAGSSYRVTFKSGSSGIKDLSGNALGADYAIDFTPEAAAPTLPTPASNVTYLAKGTAFPAVPNGAFRIQFSEAIRSTSLVPPTANLAVVTPGNVQVLDAGNNQLLGGLTVDAADPRVVYFQPTGPTGAVITAQTYTVKVLGTVQDLAGNPLGSPVTQTVAVATP